MKAKEVFYRVMEDVFQVVTEKLEFGEVINEEERDSYFRKILAVGDIWVECIDEETGELALYCYKGEMKGEDSVDRFDPNSVMEYLAEI